MTDLQDIEERVRNALRSVAQLPVPQASAPAAAAAGAGARDERALADWIRRNGKALATVAVVLTTAAAASLLLAYGPRSGGGNEGRGQGPANAPGVVQTSVPVAAASASLDEYVASESSKEVNAASGSSQNTWGDASIAEHSPPVEENGTYDAVVAFGFDPSGRPVKVLSYSAGGWSEIASLPPPNEPGTVDHPDSLDLVGDTTPVAVGYATDALPDFLIPFAGAGCGEGPVVSDVGGSWRYIPFTGPFPTEDTLGGNPRFEGNALVSDNDCAAEVPAGQRHRWTWSYDAPSGDFVATQHSGWPPNP